MLIKNTQFKEPVKYENDPDPRDLTLRRCTKIGAILAAGVVFIPWFIWGAMWLFISWGGVALIAGIGGGTIAGLIGAGVGYTSSLAIERFTKNNSFSCVTSGVGGVIVGILIDWLIMTNVLAGAS